MLMFNEFLLQDEHEHRNFDAILKCYLAHVATLRKSGDADALKFKCTKEVIASFEKDYEEALTRRVATATSMQASDLLEDGLAQQAGGISGAAKTLIVLFIFHIFSNTSDIIASFDNRSNYTDAEEKEKCYRDRGAHMADKRTREAFSDEDWDAIKSRAAAIQDPVLHAAVERYLNKFDLSGSRNKLDKLKAATLIDGMKGVNLGYVGLAKEDQIQYELELVRKLMLDWWFLYRKESGPFTAGTLLSEAWWSSHCFSVLGHLPVKATRKKIGTKSDIFIRTLGHTSRDWSVVESGHLWDSFGNKVIGESRIKVSRQLHDILCHRAQETKWTDQFINEAKVVGIVTGGSMLTRMDLVFGGGRYTTILKGHGLFKMGETLNQFKQSLKVAKFLLQTRGLIVNLMTLFYQCMDDSENDDEEQDYVNEYIASSPSGEYDTINLE
ncbi:hypothetical protein BGZ58_002370 [Dissophora ornata]|nr:hypothetical protein BGZ58_002370 [Dissophora ornata]